MDSDEERNYYCLLLLLLRVGTLKIRAYFIRKWDTVPGHRPWSNCPQDGADLMAEWKPTILQYEKSKILSGNTSLWDLLLFVKVLLSHEADPLKRRALGELKFLRNSLCHSNDAKLTDLDFQRKWNDACNALMLFGATLEDFKRVEKDAKQPLKDLKLVAMEWLNHDLELLHNGQRKLLQEIDKVEEGQFRLYDKIEQSQNILLELLQIITAGVTRSNTLTSLALENVGLSSRGSKGEELAKYLKEHYRTGERSFLLPLPGTEGDQFHIGNFTTTKIVEMNTNHDASLEDIFFNDTATGTDLQNTRRILIEGEPGIGKSSICKKIAYDWSMDKNPQLFPTFDVVLFLKCRNFHTGRDLWDAIENQTFSDCLKEQRNEIFKYLENYQHKVLLILDGYDEIPDKSADSMKQSIERLIGGQLLPYCSVIVTSRPGKSSEIRNHFHRKLEIKGFELNDSFTLIRRFFFSAAPENSLVLISFIKRCEAAKDLVRSPLNTIILCLMPPEKKKDESLNLDTLHRDIVFSLFKRYCSEKLDMMTEFDSSTYFLGKLAFNLIKENRFGINGNDLAVVPAGPQYIDIGFLVKRKSVNQIRPENSYNFVHDSIKEYLAKSYVEISFKSLNGKEIYSIIMNFKDFASFSRTLKFLYHLIKSKICVLLRFIRFIFDCFLSRISIAMKIITCFVRAVRARA